MNAVTLSPNARRLIPADERKVIEAYRLPGHLHLHANSPRGPIAATYYYPGGILPRVEASGANALDVIERLVARINGADAA